MSLYILPALIAMGMGNAVLPTQVQNQQIQQEKNQPVSSSKKYSNRGYSKPKPNGGRPMFKQNRRAQIKANRKRV